jgi:hypothetical protein
MNFLVILLLFAQAIPLPSRSDRVVKPPVIQMIERGPAGCRITWKFCGEADVFRVTRSDPSGIMQQRFICPHAINPQSFIAETKVHTFSWSDGWPTDSITVYTYAVTAFTATEFDLDSKPMEIKP